MSRTIPFRASRPTLLPTAAFDLFDRTAVRDALHGPDVPTADEAAMELIEVLDAMGAEGMNTLHLPGTELGLAVDRDLHTSASWLAGALFDAMDRTRGAA